VVGAIDRRVGCVVAQVPTISGWESTLRRTPPPALAGQRQAFDADRLGRFRGEAPQMVPMVVDPAEGGAASHASADAWEFFTGQSSPPEDAWRFRKWRNEITLRSLELYSEYEPGSFVERIGPTPLLMIMGDADVVCPTDLGLDAFNRARAQAARALPGRSLLGLHRPVRARFQRGDRVVHRPPATRGGGSV
jgi:uncharacterized protein